MKHYSIPIGLGDKFYTIDYSVKEILTSTVEDINIFYDYLVDSEGTIKIICSEAKNYVRFVTKCIIFSGKDCVISNAAYLTKEDAAIKLET